MSVNPGGVNTGEADLSSFRAKGGKLLVYHGRSDQANPSAHSQEYFQRVQEAMDLDLNEMLDFYRVFWLEGMHHCVGGPGAWNIGQVGTGPVPVQLRVARHSALLALVDWVEKDQPPMELVGTKFVEDDWRRAVQSQRGECRISASWCMLTVIVHCAYPTASRWNGIGEVSEASSWSCTER